MQQTMFIVLASVLALCTPFAAADDGLRVLVWNVWRGGNEVDQGPEKILAVIRDAEPDVVLLQESYDINGDRPKLGAWVADELGWNQFQGDSTHLCVLTPLQMDATFFHHEWHGVGARLHDVHGRSFLAWSIWLDYRHFGGYLLRDKPDTTDEELLACEHTHSDRLKQATALLAYLRDAGQLDADVPLLVGGDWNCPSHLDWTHDTTRVFPRRRALDLPVSLAVTETGLQDTFRVLHPNPVHHPGITWSPMFRGPRHGADGTPQAFERIDRLYLRNPTAPEDGWSLTPVAATVLPEVWEDDSVPVKQRTFPSDHCGVLIDLQWREGGSGP